MTPKEPRVVLVRFDRGRLLDTAESVGRFDVLRATLGPSSAKWVEWVRPEHERRRSGTGGPSVASIVRRCDSRREGLTRKAFRRALGSTPRPYRRTSRAEELGV